MDHQIKQVHLRNVCHKIENLLLPQVITYHKAKEVQSSKKMKMNIIAHAKWVEVQTSIKETTPLMANRILFLNKM